MQLKNEPEAIVEDARGKLIQVTSKSTWKQLNIITRQKDTFGGGHYHKKTREYFYILSGKLILKVYPINASVGATYRFTRGNCFEVVPLEQHYMKFQEDTTLVVLYSKAFNALKPDTFVEEKLPKLKEVFSENR